MPTWPPYQQQPPVYAAAQGSPFHAPAGRIQSDRHGWSEFIASQTQPGFLPRQFYSPQYVNHYAGQRSSLGPNRSYGNSANNARKDFQVFCVDRVGLEHNKPPTFTQRYKVALPDNEEQSCLQAPAGGSRKSACFNCLDTDHLISDCPHPRDPERIRQNKQLFRRVSGGSSSMSDGFHGPGDRRLLRGGVSSARRLGKYTQLQPGEYSRELRSALGLNDQQLPPFVYRMRELGYPPGWLQECLVYRSVNDGSKEEYDFDRLISFPGFNQAPSEEFLDESDLYGVPEYSDEMFGKESFVQSLINSGCVAINANHSDEEDKGDPMELDEEEDVDKLGNAAAVVEKEDTARLKEDGTASRDCDPKGDNGTPVDPKPVRAATDSNNHGRSESDNDIVDLDKLNDWTESFLARDNIGATLETSDGTPLLFDDETLNYKRPSVEKFAAGINEHRFFENLPGTVGNFARIMKTVKSARDHS